MRAFEAYTRRQEFGMLYSARKLREFIGPAPILPSGSVVRSGKDVHGFYPGQLGRVHKAHTSRGAPGPFSKLQPAPVNYEAKTPFQPDFDNSALGNYVRFQKLMEKTTIDWYNQTSYKAAFDLPYHNSSHENKYTPKDPGPRIIWTSTGRRMFSTFQACT
ncbi:uncharacterized protein C1orf100 homolog [Rissa tridactyla]|uniref:uncharacterized protein C1orf100 homolog n=1 Tax=Rissa tridactyla TaxID=75485 RepID=UPI0023BA5FF0|nr:uncharacterized protein C1orf100 homolog [Rissa tridactyla]